MTLGSQIWGPPSAEVAAEFADFSLKLPKPRYLEAQARREQRYASGTLSFLQGGDVARMIINYRDERKPGSFTRMSDGEGNLVASAYEMGVPPALLDYCFDRISYIHFGDPSVVRQAKQDFDAMIRETVDAADLLGFPMFGTVDRGFDTPDENKDVRAIVGNRASFLLLDHLGSQVSVHSDAWFSRGLLPYYIDILRGQDAIAVISSYPELSGRLQSAFEIGVVDFIQVPTQAVFVSSRKRSNTGHYPDGMNAILDSIRPRHQGQIFVVAAGLLAKRYCTEIKKRGGIAIDVGSIAEVWLGIQARGMDPNWIEKWRLRA